MYCLGVFSKVLFIILIFLINIYSFQVVAVHYNIFCLNWFYLLFTYI